MTFKTIKELEAEIEELVADDNTINDYEQTLKEIQEKFEAKNKEDLETGMFILLKVAQRKALKDVLGLINEICEPQHNRDIAELKKRITG